MAANSSARPDRLREVVVHAGREAALAVFLPRPRRQGDDGQMSPRGPLPLPDRMDDLEAVEFGHVKVQEQQVEIRRPGRERVADPCIPDPEHGQGHLGR